MKGLRIRGIGAVWLLLGLAVALPGFDWIFQRSPASMSDNAALWRAGFLTLGAWMAFFVTPVAVAAGSSAYVSAGERNAGQLAFLVCGIGCPILQVAAELVQGPWYGLLGFIFKAMLANGFWFMFASVIMNSRIKATEKMLAEKATAS